MGDRAGRTPGRETGNLTRFSYLRVIDFARTGADTSLAHLESDEIR